jgi:putative ABC transport system permease protein
MILLRYAWRSLVVRKTTSLATALGIGLVVFVFSAVAMLSTGIRRALSASGHADVALLLRQGSDAEVTSAIEMVHVPLLLAPRQVARDAEGNPAGVAEMVALLNVDRADGAGVASLQVRGVAENAYAFRPEVKITQGRKARPGAFECVIGRSLQGRFAGLDIGSVFELSESRSLRVVGIFEAVGSSLESELWADVQVVRSAFAREGHVQSVRVRLSDASAFDAYRKEIEANPQLGVSVRREQDYFAAQGQESTDFIVGMGGVIVMLFSLGAAIGAMITMYAAVAHRQREIGLLRALGFGVFSIAGCFLFEAVLLGLIGGAIGALGSVAMSLARFSLVSAQGWHEMIFRFEPSLGGIFGSLLLAVVLGVLGGALPALRASRLQLVAALRD